MNNDNLNANVQLFENNGLYHSTYVYGQALVGIGANNDGLCIKNEGFDTKNDDFVLHNDEYSIAYQEGGRGGAG